VAWRASKRYLEMPGPRHEADYYDQSQELHPLQRGDRMYIRCEGGPSNSRLEAFPPRLEIDESGGMYTLIDVGAREDWYYIFVPRLAR
jgi:hypothetical protein